MLAEFSFHNFLAIRAPPSAFSFTYFSPRSCDECGGKGTTVKRVCTTCGGHKVIPDEEVITIYVERGMDNGDEIVFSEAGDQSPGITPGDLKFVVQTQPHQRFRRKGNSLYITMHISLLEVC